MKDCFCFCHRWSNMTTVIRAVFLLTQTHVCMFACGDLSQFLSTQPDPFPTPTTLLCTQGPLQLRLDILHPIFALREFNVKNERGLSRNVLRNSHMWSQLQAFLQLARREPHLLANFTFPSLFMQVSGEHEAAWQPSDQQHMVTLRAWNQDYCSWHLRHKSKEPERWAL